MERLTEEQHVEDEFTCASVLRGALVALQPTVEWVFGVTLSLGGEDAVLTQDTEMWLRLWGAASDVQAAKLFVRGVISQEAQHELRFPEALQCVFCGANGLFMSSLIKMTSAQLVVRSPGCLLITGLEEPVVKAFSFITDLVEKYKCSQGQRTESGLVMAGEFLGSRQHFKSLVEGKEDHHTINLLALPVAVKEILLDLVNQPVLNRKSGKEVLNPFESHPSWAMHGDIDDLLPRESENSKTKKHAESLVNQKRVNVMSLNPHVQLSDLTPQSGHGRSNGMHDSARRTTDFSSEFSHCFIPVSKHRTYLERPEEAEMGSPQKDESDKLLQETVLISAKREEEFEHLLKFFTAMGFTQEVVQQVLTQTGPKEASQILDLIQQEQDKTEGRGNLNSQTQKIDSVTKRTCVGSVEIKGAVDMSSSSKEPQTVKEDDFVLDVLKKAAATCGYTEERVEQVYSNLPELKPRELLMELQREQVKEADRTQHNDTKVDQTVGRNSAGSVEKPSTGRGKIDAEGRNKILMQPEALKWTDMKSPTTSQNQVNLLSVRGPPQTTYPSKKAYETSRNQQPVNSDFQFGSSHQQSSAHLSPTKISNISSSQHHSAVSKQKKTQKEVTGPQRFIESLKTPFKLQLSDDPGDDMLRQIIIDGSNVAKSHGLGLFFSCRGIALAVQHFWGRGHRKITVFVPQWRLKRDPRTKEQQFLTELQDLGLLSFTPSREVEGKRINSYDDRFMLRLAQKTSGVIVTNDNFRDLMNESPAWRDIIRRSLLQYVFVEDLFMLPDDPMGRGGPHLNDFLHMQHSSFPHPGSHSFAGVSSSLSSPSPVVRPHTEVLQYRDMTPGGGRGHHMDRGEEVRTVVETLELKKSLGQMFPDQESIVIMTLQCHPTVRDIDQLANFILE